jgi:hypothetical protein
VHQKRKLFIGTLLFVCCSVHSKNKRGEGCECGEGRKLDACGSVRCLFSMKKNIDGQDTENRVLEVGIFVHKNCDHADVREETAGTSDDVFFRKPQLTGCVKASIVDGVVVTLCKEFHGSVRPKMREAASYTNADPAKNAKYSLFMQLNDSVNNWNVSSFNFKHNDFTNANRLFGIVGKEQQVTSVESRFHRSAQHDYDGRFASGHDHQALPDHESRRDDHTEAQDLVEKLQKFVIRRQK